MKYQTLDGKIFEAATYQEAAHVLWQMMFIPEPTIEEWMVGSAHRAKMWNGADVPVGSLEEHVEGLIRAQVLELIG